MYLRALHVCFATLIKAQQTIVLQWLLVVDPVDIFRGQEEERHEVAACSTSSTGRERSTNAPSIRKPLHTYQVLAD
eukprot:2384284-Amphidinium_carterae.1